ncbi:sigma-70 family RNA polymerase sigma factor [Antarctobacter heliothermus]|uniref:RNA polymerase sigma-70 factor, ECF subfamily n=1 Tax=Antarctobacter heliothermus TaxID=74033 RepID=A0A239EDC3_9RHOB|nr:sigma-70 family RNA polymerase sigma factor [Antarctobacter heliothermus]SNS42519.1 RNA polymerase sigma-70 factor, ECF subfamily [Antarctobacter heliothermus]
MTTRGDIETLIARTALRDRTAFAALYDATSGKLLAVCHSVLKDRQEAEDTLQEVFLRVWNKADRYAVTGHSPMTWLITVARNIAIDRLRARQKAQTGKVGSETDVLPDTRPGPEAATIAASESRRIVACLRELPGDRANAVRGAYLEGKSYSDLAARFDVPLNTMRTWLRRSLQSLRECMSR